MAASGSATKATTTAIRGGIIVAHDGTDHRILKDGVLVYSGDRITYVGRRHDGPVDQTIKADGRLVIPGLISTHAHVSAQEGNRLVVDGGRRDFLRSGFLNYVPGRESGGQSFFKPIDGVATVRYGMASLLRNGVTTVIPFDPGLPDNGQTVVDLAGEMGIRIYYAPDILAATYLFDDQGRLSLRWNEPGGFKALERAVAFIEKHNGAHSGRVQAILTVDESFTATVPLLREVRKTARQLGIGVTLHFSEQVYEFHNTVRETGRTPVQRLADIAFLDRDVILAHCLYVSGHPYVTYPYSGDLELLAQSQVNVSHSPAVYARRGIALYSFQRYLDHGIRLSLGTDAFPLDVMEEMRFASTVCKVVEANHESANAADVFRAATTGGADALGRTDLGRLAAGAKADIVLIDFDNLRIGPVHDPIRSLVHLATGDMVRTVIVDGRTVVDEGKLLVCDEHAVLKAAVASTEAAWREFPKYHWASRSVDQEFPPSFKELAD